MQIYCSQPALYSNNVYVFSVSLFKQTQLVYFCLEFYRVPARCTTRNQRFISICCL